MLTITDAARSQIIEIMEREGQEDKALRLAIVARRAGAFVYQFGFVDRASRVDADTVVEEDGFEVLVDPATAAYLEGTTVDLVDGRFGIDNPNPIWDDPVSMRVQELLDAQINPAVASHGGFVTLLGVRDGAAHIRFGGGCQGCGMVDVTLKHGVEAQIIQAVPEIEAVVDATDHAGGTNPFYKPGGPSDGESAVPPPPED